jgi:hypothetical protein
MEKMLASWKNIYMSKGGHLTLIKSTLSSLPTYFLSLFPLLVDIARRLERLQRDFLWDGPGGESKFHMVNWRTICSPFPRAGLGVKNIMFNKAFLSKWLWRFMQEENFLRKQVFVEKYGSREEVGVQRKFDGLTR